NTPVETESLTGRAWVKTNAGTYTVVVQVMVGEKEIGSVEYTFVIGKATNSSLGLTVSAVVLGEGANFKFPVTADFGANTVKYQYRKEGSAETAWSDNVPTEAGRWLVKATIAGTDNYTGAEATKQFEVRANGANAEVGEGYVEGSLSGGDGVGAGWQLVITDKDVSSESISKQNVLDGYDVVLKDEFGTVHQPEKAYTVRIKLSDELSEQKGLNIFYKNEDGKLTKLDASVEDGYIVFKTNNFGSFIITTAQPKESVGLLVSTIVLGAVAAGGIAACIVVFILKKKKRGAQ
ncbi:MAG: hypothetical protein K2K04_01915, partial [Clostridia bacterium]|nr:hypothetical protein [Clostridia bacterium]